MLDKLSMFVESIFKLLNFFGPPKQEKYYSLCAVANNATFVLPGEHRIAMDAANEAIYEQLVGLISQGRNFRCFLDFY